MLVILVVAAAIVVAMWMRGGGHATVRTAFVEESSGVATNTTVLNASGYVTARRQATVSSKITGKVVEVLIEEGMTVREGDVVARLDDSRERAVLRLAESRLEAARYRPSWLASRARCSVASPSRISDPLARFR